VRQLERDAKWEPPADVHDTAAGDQPPLHFGQTE